MTGVQNSPNFTGVVLSDYGEGDSFDANGARATVNGTDRASLIAGYATDWLGKLDSLYSARALTAYDSYAYGPLDILSGIASGVTGAIEDATDTIRRSVGDTISTITRLINGQPAQNQVLPRSSPSPNPISIANQVRPSNGKTSVQRSPTIEPTPSPTPGNLPIDPGEVLPGAGGSTNGGESPSPSPTTTPTPTTTPSPVPVAAPTYKGTTMTITLGMWGQFRDARLYQFIYTSVSANLIPPYTVTLVGRSIRWNISEGRLPGEDSGGPTIIPGVSAPVTTPDLTDEILENTGDGTEIDPSDVLPGAGGLVNQLTDRVVGGGAAGTVGGIRNTPSGPIISPIIQEPPQPAFSAKNLGRLTVLENVTLDEIARRVGYQSGVNVRVAPRASQFKYGYVKFDQKNPLKTLVKLAKNAGFRVVDSSNYPRLAYAPGDDPKSTVGLDQGGDVTTTGLGEIAEVTSAKDGVSITPEDGEIIVEDEAGEDGAGVAVSDRMVPQITFRIGRSQVTNLSISDEASADRVVTGDLGEAVTLGVPEDSAKLDVESGDLLPPDSIPVGLGDEVSGGIGGSVGGGLPPGISPIVEEPPAPAFSFAQIDSVGIRRTFEIGGGGLLGESDFSTQVLGYAPTPGAAGVVDEILAQVNQNPVDRAVDAVTRASEAITRAIRGGNARPPIGAKVSVSASNPVEDIPGNANPIIPGVTPAKGGVVAPDPSGEPDDPNAPDSADEVGSDTVTGGVDPGTAPAPPTAEASQPLPDVKTIPDHTSIGRGYPTTTRVMASSVTLALKPGDFVQLVDGFVPEPFNRRWRIDRIRHSLSDDGFWTDIFFYLPVKIQRRSTSSGGSGAAPAGGVGAAPGGAQGNVADVAALENMTSLTFVSPNPTGTLTSDMGPRTAPTAGASSNHRGQDIAAGQGTPLLACAAGVVVDIGTPGGYGPDSVTLYHGSVTGSDGQYFIGSMYGHGSGVKVAVGDLVQQGQEIVLEDTQGVSTGSHLHWNVYASKTFKPEAGNPFPGDFTVFVNGTENFIDQAWTSDGNIKGHRFTS